VTCASGKEKQVKRANEASVPDAAEDEESEDDGAAKTHTVVCINLSPNTSSPSRYNIARSGVSSRVSIVVPESVIVGEESIAQVLTTCIHGRRRW
jgi:hypothetical protein